MLEEDLERLSGSSEFGARCVACTVGSTPRLDAAYDSLPTELDPPTAAASVQLPAVGIREAKSEMRVPNCTVLAHAGANGHCVRCHGQGLVLLTLELCIKCGD